MAKQTYTITLDPATGEGDLETLAQALEGLAEYIGEDRVTQDDGVAQDMALALARFVRHGDFSTAYRQLGQLEALLPVLLDDETEATP